MAQTKDDRIYLRLPAGLKEKVQEYAKQKHTTVSELTIRFFTKLLEEEERLRNQPIDADQV
jgi:hypothetical protein